jgi:NTP pyrophosphatase (non-canonical NTP hydrolase)
MEKQVIDSEKYVEFVKQVTSPASTDINVLIERMKTLDGEGVKLTHLLTFALGMIGELGETVDLLKKCLLQNKEMTPEIKRKLKLECGDCTFYLAQFCIALDVSFEELMQGNYEKLSARYPEGTFSVYRSENRNPEDN